jgi:hypothetical protein
MTFGFDKWDDQGQVVSHYDYVSLPLQNRGRFTLEQTAVALCTLRVSKTGGWSVLVARHLRKLATESDRAV